MQKYDFTAPASGASQTVNAPGRYVKYMAGNAGGNDTGLIITPGSKPGSKILLYPGQAFTLPDSVAQPNGWTFANAVGQANIAGTLVIGEGRLDDNTLQGTVQVVDGGKARTLAGAAFIGLAFCTNVAAQYSAAQLWNPSNSGKRVVVEALQCTSLSGAWAAYIGVMNTQLTTPLAVGSLSKLSGGASQSALLCTQNTAAAISTEPQYMALNGSGSNVVNGYTFKEPIVLMPGYGLTCALNNAQNLSIGATYEWFEEPNV